MWKVLQVEETTGSEILESHKEEILKCTLWTLIYKYRKVAETTIQYASAELVDEANQTE